ncbi:MAG: hypothetical protein K2Y14_09480 [Burkholderiales bacterium]|nr:hypothetical protein [Burkholderiales bacterium]
MKKTKTIRLTVRDVAIFSMLDKLGLMNSEQVSKFLKISLAAAKKRLSSLCSAQYLNMHRYLNKSSVYTLNTQQYQLNMSEFEIKKSQIEHLISVNDLYIELLKQDRFNLISHRENDLITVTSEADLAVGQRKRITYLKFENSEKSLEAIEIFLLNQLKTKNHWFIICKTPQIFEKYIIAADNNQIDQSGSIYNEFEVVEIKNLKIFLAVSMQNLASIFDKF